MKGYASIAVALLFVLAGCRGGAGSSSGIVPNSSLSKAPGTASFAISVPPAGAGGAAMQSVSVQLLQVNGSPPAAPVAPVKINLSRSTPGCAQAAGGALNCTATIAVPPGTDAFSVTTYALPNEAGAAVTTDNVVTAISPGRATSCARKNGVLQAAKSTAAVKV